MKKVFLFVIACLVASCNYSITMVASQGEASDMVDEAATSSPNTALSLPANLL